MQIWKDIINSFKKPEIKDVPQGVAFSDTQTRGEISKAYYPGFLVKPPFGWPKYKNVYEIRRVATTPQPAMAIQTIIDEICSIPWAIISKDKSKNESQQTETRIEEITTFFNNPNSNKESFGHILRIVLREILELDSGIIVKEFNKQGKFVEMRATDSAGFLKNPNLYGKITDRDDLILEEFVNVDFELNFLLLKD